MKEPGAARRNEVQTRALAARGRSSHGDVAWVAPELRDVVADPNQRRPLIEESVVSSRAACWIFCFECGMGKEAEWSETVVRLHHDHPGLLSEPPSVRSREV